MAASRIGASLLGQKGRNPLQFVIPTGRPPKPRWGSSAPETK